MSRAGWCLGLVAMMTTTGLAGSARAEEPPPAPATAPAGPDLVLLKNGGMLRGTIAELIPGETVTIVTATGKTREIAMSEVSYAGRADEAPKSEGAQAAPQTSAPAANVDTPAAPANNEVRPYVIVNSKTARVKLKSVEPGVTFHRADSSAVAVGSGGVAIATGYERLCTAPCEVTMPAGTEVLALSRTGSIAREAGPVTLPPGESTLIGSFENRGGVRVAGWLIAAASVGIGAYLIGTSLDKKQDCSYGYCSESSEINTGKLIGGTVIMAVGGGVGVFMGVMPDKPHVRVATQAPLPTAHGVTLHGVF